MIGKIESIIAINFIFARNFDFEDVFDFHASYPLGRDRAKNADGAARGVKNFRGDFLENGADDPGGQSIGPGSGHTETDIAALHRIARKGIQPPGRPDGNDPLIGANFLSLAKSLGRIVRCRRPCKSWICRHWHSR